MQKKAVIFFIVWATWISFEYLLGPYSHVRIFDAGNLHLPLLIAQRIQITKYGLSYFGNFFASGVDLTTLNFAPFSTFNNFLFFVFNGYFAYGILMFIQRFIASFFMYRLCKDVLKLKVTPSLFAALAYSLYNFSIDNYTIYHQLSEPGFPLFLWLIHYVPNVQSKLKYICSFIIGASWGFSTYLALGIPFFIPGAALWFLLIDQQKKKSFWALFLLIIVGAALVSIPQVWALILNIPNSHRSLWGSNNYVAQNPFQEYIIAILIAIGTYKLQFFLSFISVLLMKKNVIFKQSNLMKLIVISCSILIISPAFSVLELIFKTHLGLFESFQFSRFYILLPFFLTVTTATFLNSLLSIKKQKYHIGLLLLVIAFAFIFIETIKIKIDTVLNYAPYKLLYELPELKELRQNDQSIYRVATINGGGLRSAYLYAYGFETVDGYAWVYPKTYFQYWSEVIAKRIKNDPVFYNDFETFGSRMSLYGPNDFDTISEIPFNNYYDLDLLSLANVKYIISKKPISNSNLTLLPSEYREYLKGTGKLTGFKKLALFIQGKYYGDPIFIYRNKKVLPRFFVRRDDDESSGDVNVLEYSPDRIRLSVNADTDSKLIASINYYPYWHAYSNGKEVSIHTFSGTFMSINLEKGSRILEIDYLPPYRVL